MTMRPTKSLALLVAAFVSTVVAVAAAGQAAGTQSPGATYTVGPSDVLKVLVFNEDQLSGSFRVEPDGSIVYAMLGRMHVAGRTEREIAALIEKELANGWLNKPQVAVQVEQFRSRTIFIAGEVRTPGKYPLQGDNTLLEVLALAGSITGNASNEVVIVRPKTADAKAMPTLPDSGAEAEVLRVDLQKIEQGFTSSNILLQDGDTVFVPRAEKFYISGHVRSPGAYAYNKGMTIQQAIAVAGGVSERGSTRGIKVRREVKPGSGEYIEIDVRLSDQIRPNDTIIVRQRYI
jgi:polysaccharide export outer membrane protein